MRRKVKSAPGAHWRLPPLDRPARLSHKPRLPTQPQAVGILGDGQTARAVAAQLVRRRAPSEEEGVAPQGRA